MTQGPLTIADSDGGTVLAALNAALLRLATKGSGTARPSDIQPHEFWVETDSPGAGVHTVWWYDGSNDISFATVDTTSHAVALTAAITSAQLDTLLSSSARGQVPMRGASAWGVLTPGQAGADLRSGGSGADLVWKKRAWAHVTGQGGATVVKSTNITSVTRTGPGNFTVVMANAMPDASYRVVCSNRYAVSYPAVSIFEDATLGARSTTTFYLSTWSVSGYTDPDALDFEVWE